MPWGSEKERTSFLKKRSKKLLIPEGVGICVAKARSYQKFFASFFQKRSACFLLP
jgi:hypothetical protein